MSKLIAQGAEAKILLAKNQITKNRTPKFYRLEQLDNKIRKSRTKKETKLMINASKIINVPIPEIKDAHKIIMPFIEGKKLSEALDSFSLTKQKTICKQIGKDTAKLHDANIIHGDLTTSNMILVETQKNLPAHPCSQSNKNSINKQIKQSALKKSSTKPLINERSEPIIFFIDFGLGFISHKLEDKAVDLHLLKQALEAKHYIHWETLWKEVEKGYKTSKNSKVVFERLKAVEKRGRYKH